MTAADKSKVYGSIGAGPTSDSERPGRHLGAANNAFSASRAAGESVADGPYKITPAASDGATGLLGNDDVTYYTGTTITRKAASVTAVDKSKVYGSDDPELTTTDSGFLVADLGADKIAFRASRAAGESVAGGPYAITPAASDGATGLLGRYLRRHLQDRHPHDHEEGCVGDRGGQVEGVTGSDHPELTLVPPTAGSWSLIWAPPRLPSSASRAARRIGCGWPVQDHAGRLGR